MTNHPSIVHEDIKFVIFWNKINMFMKTLLMLLTNLTIIIHTLTKFLDKFSYGFHRIEIKLHYRYHFWVNFGPRNLTDVILCFFSFGFITTCQNDFCSWKSKQEECLSISPKQYFTKFQEHMIPLSARSLTISFPIPPLLPVTTTTFSFISCLLGHCGPLK